MKLATAGLLDCQFVYQDKDKIQVEYDVICKEVESILNSLLFVGEGDIENGLIKGFEMGVLDIPFSPSIYNNGDLVTIRDNQGAVRIAAFGNLPFNKEIKSFHRERLSSRIKSGKKSEVNIHSLLEYDILKIPRCDYDVWPIQNW